MTPKLFMNWLHSIEHQYGQRACEALACNLIHRSTLQNISHFKPADIVDIHKVIEAFEIRYEGGLLPTHVFQWLLNFYQMTDYESLDNTPSARTIQATHYLLRIMLGVPTEDGIPAWMRSVIFSMGALGLHPRTFMPDAQFFLEHLE